MVIYKLYLYSENDLWLLECERAVAVTPRRTWLYQVQHVAPWNNIVMNQLDLKNKFIIFVKFRLIISVWCLYISVIHL